MRLSRIAVLGILCTALLALAGCDSSGSNMQQNQAPTANVSVPSSTVDVGTQVTLDGSGSSDPDGDDLTFSWTLNTPSGSNASLSDASAEKPTFTADAEGDYTATLEVSDGDATDTDDATITAETQSNVVEIDSDITSDGTWTADNIYLVTTTVAVDNSSTLTIEPGTEVRFENDVAFHVNGGASLVADGTSDDPVSMTATDGNEQQGWWRGVAIYSGNTDNTMNYVEVRHAGSTDMNGISEAANVALNGGPNSAATLTLTNSTIADGAGYGVYFDTDTDTFQDFASNSFSGTANAPMWIPFDQVGALDEGSSFPAETTVRVFGGSFDAAIASEVSMAALSGDTPYRFSSTPNVNDGGTLTVDPGVEMTFENDVAFHVNGGASLVADGTSDDPISMTATAGNEQQGWWRGVAIYSSNTNNTMNYVEVRHAGSTDMGGISEAANVALRSAFSGGFFDLENSILTDSGNHGIYCDGDDATFSDSGGNTFNNNAGQNVANCQ